MTPRRPDSRWRTENDQPLTPRGPSWLTGEVTGRVGFLNLTQKRNLTTQTRLTPTGRTAAITHSAATPTGPQPTLNPQQPVTPPPFQGAAAVKHRPIRYPDASTPKASAPGRLRPVRSIDAGQPDPAGVALGAPPGAVAGSSAFNAWMVADQNRIFGQRMPRGTTAGHRLRQLLATDPVVPIGQAKVVWPKPRSGLQDRMHPARFTVSHRAAGHPQRP
jgi:hypothetical protein